VEELGIRRLIDAQIRPHGGWQGISVGTVVSSWLCHLLMERDHRLVAVRDWAAARVQTLNDLLGIRLRATDLTDDRLANVLTMLGEPDDQAAVDQGLLADWIRVYALPQQTVRLDSTSVSVYQDPAPPEGLIRHGVSKEHRPDLAQFKVMLASLDPLGLPLACHAVPGNRSDDLLYVPAYDAAMRTLETSAVLVVGDNKMTALATRAHIVAGGSAYLCAYRPAAATAQIAGWVADALAQPERWHELRAVDERTGEVSTLAVVAERERLQQAGETAWTERVLVARSARAQAGLLRRRERMLARVAEQVAGLSHPPGHGRRVYPRAADLEAAVAELLRAACLEGSCGSNRQSRCGAMGRRAGRSGPTGWIWPPGGTWWTAWAGRSPSPARPRSSMRRRPSCRPTAGRPFRSAASPASRRATCTSGRCICLMSGVSPA
jgi:transposase